MEAALLPPQARTIILNQLFFCYYGHTAMMNRALLLYTFANVRWTAVGDIVIAQEIRALLPIKHMKRMIGYGQDPRSLNCHDRGKPKTR